MAEGLLRARGSDAFAAFSAGTDDRGQSACDPGDSGSTSGANGQDARRVSRGPFDLVITVCDSAREACPVFPGAQARAGASGRRVRGEIATRVDVIVAERAAIGRIDQDRY
jgi:arsenate reductase